MSQLRRYLARIGRRGGIRSRRSLDPETARQMVRAREARRAERRQSPHLRTTGGVLVDTTAAAQAAQDDIFRRLTPASKLRRVSELSRTVDALARAGTARRYPEASARELRYRIAVTRLGKSMADRVYGPPE